MSAFGRKAGIGWAIAGKKEAGLLWGPTDAALQKELERPLHRRMRDARRVSPRRNSELRDLQSRVSASNFGRPRKI